MSLMSNIIVKAIAAFLIVTLALKMYILLEQTMK